MPTSVSATQKWLPLSPRPICCRCFCLPTRLLAHRNQLARDGDGSRQGRSRAARATAVDLMSCRRHHWNGIATPTRAPGRRRCLQVGLLVRRRATAVPLPLRRTSCSPLPLPLRGTSCSPPHWIPPACSRCWIPSACSRRWIGASVGLGSAPPPALGATARRKCAGGPSSGTRRKAAATRGRGRGRGGRGSGANRRRRVEEPLGDGRAGEGRLDGAETLVARREEEGRGGGCGKEGFCISFVGDDKIWISVIFPVCNLFSRMGLLFRYPLLEIVLEIHSA